MVNFKWKMRRRHCRVNSIVRRASRGQWVFKEGALKKLGKSKWNLCFKFSYL